MGKNKKRIPKNKMMAPDEAFSKGPIHLARFGKNVVMRSSWTGGQHAEFMGKLAEDYPKVVSKIDRLVAQIVSEVSVLPPDKLLLKAWQRQVMTSRHVEVEADVTEADAIALRMIDYIQGVIASAPRGEVQKDEVSDEDFDGLQEKVFALFKALNFEYPMCATAHRRLNLADYDDAMEEFFVRAQMHWCNVRGDFYQVHQLDILGSLLKNQSHLIESAYGITSEQLLKELGKVWRSLIFGLHDVMSSMFNMHSVVMAEVERMLEQDGVDLSAHSMGELIFKAAANLGHEDTLRNGFSALGGMDLFDLRKITDLPESFLSDFSWAPGEEKDFLAEGEFKGWPLRIQPVFKRPFLSLNGTYYCFDLHMLFDNFYRQLEKRIFQRSEAEKQEWIRNRKDVSESLPVDYLVKLLPGATVFQEVYYPVGNSKEFAEADCIIIYDDHLFIVEVKAGAFTYTSPANDLPAYISSLKGLVAAPSKQGQRFLKYLESADQVDLFDAKRKPVASICKDHFRVKTICAITLDLFTEIAAQAQHLHKVGVDIGDTPVWPLSISDLRVYRDIFAGPLDFLHFVEQRIRAATSEKLQLDDELDHLGLYLEHNDYSLHAEALSKNGARMHFNGYRSAVDKYFSDVLIDDCQAVLPVQEVPPRLREIIDFLASQRQKGGSQIASYLLDFAGDWRSDIDKWIDKELADIVTRGRCLPMSSVGDVRLTIFLNIDGVAVVSHEMAIEHAQTAMIVTGESDRYLLELTYNSNGVCKVLSSLVSLHGLSSDRYDLLRGRALDLKEKRLARSVANFGSIGRNELCPCGSGKKFKRCCIG